MNRSSSTPPSSRHRSEYCAPPARDLLDVVGQQVAQELGRARAARLDLAHVRDVEEARACVRTATCSWRTPSYCTGISQPANGTMRAPARDMRVIQRRALEVGGGGGHGRATLATGAASSDSELPVGFAAEQANGPEWLCDPRVALALSRPSETPGCRSRRRRSRARGGRGRPSRPRGGRRRCAACGLPRPPSKPVAITVTRTSSCMPSSITEPKMMLRVLVGGRGDDLGRLVDLEQAEVLAAGDVQQDAGRALDRLLEQRRGDRVLGGLGRAVLAAGASRCPSGPSRRRA